MAVYGVVGFVVLQIMELVVPALLLPEWTYRFVGVLLLVGFPVALVLAWAFEMTPDGVQRTRRADPGEITQIVAAPAAKRWPVGLAAAGGTALLLIGAWFVLGRPGPGGEVGDSEAIGTAGPTPAEASIAVLPFSNLAADQETQPFVDGIHDDLLTQLSKIGALTVISRTSVLEYRNTTKNVRDIAAELGVATVLEGGVQRAGDRYRINVQLIDADTDAHLWAEQYSGELTVANIFEVQTRIAMSIAGALESTLTSGERENLERLPTEDLEAYEAYQRARELAWSGVESEMRTGDRLTSHAIERDSSFAEAYALKAVFASLLYWFHYDRSDSIAAAARDLSARALELAPGLPEGHWARGHYYYRIRLDYDRSLEEVELALRGRPGEADYEALAGDNLRRKGDMRGALERYLRTVELAPRTADAAQTVAQTYGLLHEYDAAERWYLRSNTLRPDIADVYNGLARVRIQAAGDTAGARRWLAEAVELGVYYHDDQLNLVGLEMIARNPEASVRAAESWPGGVYSNQFQYWPTALAVGLALQLGADTVEARAAFDSARAILEPLVAVDPTEPRYRSALGLALAGLGRGEDAVREAEEGVRLMPPEREAWRGMWRVHDLAHAYAMTGRTEEAIDRLEFLLSVPSDVSVWLLRFDPAWDPLRGHPRFEALVAAE
jgi:TolB-like protein/Flp pilus assembly protein TadD